MPFPDRSPTAVSDAGRHARGRGDAPEADPCPAGTRDHATWRRGYEMPDAEGAPQASDGTEITDVFALLLVDARG